MNKNKVSILKFIGIILCGGIIGAIFSTSIRLLDDSINLSTASRHITQLLIDNILAIQLIILVPCFLIIGSLYGYSYRSLRQPDLSDAQEDRIDFLLSIGTLLSTLSIIFLYVTCGITISHNINNLFVSESNTFSLSSVAIFLIGTVLSSSCEIIGIKLCQKLHPEKKGDPLSMKFHKDWIGSLDEGEKMVSYVAGFKTAMLMKNVFIFTWMVLLLFGMFIPLGVVPFIIVGILWAIFTIAYSYYSHQVEKGKINY